jgi:hypothetical protein
LDDGVMGGGLNDTKVRGVVVEWLPPHPPNGVPYARVQLDARLTATGATTGETRMELTGSFVLLHTRYVGQDWASKEATVHVILESDNPLEDGSPTAWIASHAVWFHEDDQK